MHPEAGRDSWRLAQHRSSFNAMEVPQFVGGLELGAVPLTALVIATADEHLRGFMAAKNLQRAEVDERPTAAPGIEGSPLEGGGKVVIVEDVTTTGGSSIKAVERIHTDTACQVVGVISILDREEGAEQAFSEAGIHFEALLTSTDITAR